MGYVESESAPFTMRATAIVRPRQARIENVHVPVPASGQVRIRLEGCGVCASNLGPWEGFPWQNYPRGPGASGHEGWGRVGAVGDGVSVEAAVIL
jgi:D-arabinose 1-dehydrogenase-like Zn-dependent alcohol dehydrogenase